MLRQMWNNLVGAQARITESSKLYDLIVSGAFSSSGVQVNQATAMRQATVYSCVRVLAEGVAQLPVSLFRRRGDAREELVNDPLRRLVHDAPSDTQTSFEYFETMMTYLNLRGNAVAFKSMSKARNTITELIQFHPSQVEIKQNDDRSLLFIVDDGMSKDEYTQDQVWYQRGLTVDGWSGVSPIGLQRETIGLAIATEQHGAYMFKNGARMSGLLKMLPFDNAERREAFRAAFEAQTQGENSGRIAIIEGKDGTIDYQPLSMTAEDAQYLETRKFQRSEIAGIFRVPPHMVGDLERATFSNIEEQSLQFVVYSLMPWLTRIEQAMNKALLSPVRQRDHFFKFNVNGLLRGDITSRSEAQIKYLTNGVLSPDEIRAMEDWNPRADGRGGEYMTPANMELSNDE